MWVGFFIWVLFWLRFWVSSSCERGSVVVVGIGCCGVVIGIVGWWCFVCWSLWLGLRFLFGYWARCFVYIVLRLIFNFLLKLIDELVYDLSFFYFVNFVIFWRIYIWILMGFWKFWDMVFLEWGYFFFLIFDLWEVFIRNL